MTRESVLFFYRPFAPLTRLLASCTDAARECGFSPVVLSNGPHGVEGVDASYHCPSWEDWPAVRRAARELCERHGVRHLICMSEPDQHVAGICRDDNGLPGLNGESAIYFHDKNAMQARAAELGLLTPAFCLPHTLGTVERFAERVGYPILIKPYDGAGARNTWKVGSARELAELWPRFRDRRHDFRVEKFIAGRAFHVDALYRDGQIVFEQVSRCPTPPMDCVGTQRDFSSITLCNDMNDTLRSMMRQSAEVALAFGLRTGVTHNEFFVDDERGDVYFGESAARPGLDIDRAVKACYGIDLAADRARLVLSPGHRPPANRPRPSGIYSIKPTPGRLREIGSAQDLLACEGVTWAQVACHPGDRLEAAPSSTAAIASFVCQGDSYDDVIARMRRVRDSFRLVVDPAS